MNNLDIFKLNQMNISNAKKHIRKEMQQLYYYLNCLSSNDIFDAALRHHFITDSGKKNHLALYQSDENKHSQCECPLNKRLYNSY